MKIKNWFASLVGSFGADVCSRHAAVGSGSSFTSSLMCSCDLDHCWAFFGLTGKINSHWPLWQPPAKCVLDTASVLSYHRPQHNSQVNLRPLSWARFIQVSTLFPNNNLHGQTGERPRLLFVNSVLFCCHRDNVLFLFISMWFSLCPTSLLMSFLVEAVFSC